MSFLKFSFTLFQCLVTVTELSGNMRVDLDFPVIIIFMHVIEINLIFIFKVIEMPVVFTYTFLLFICNELFCNL